jgi:hypothetical protein
MIKDFLKGAFVTFLSLQLVQANLVQAQTSQTQTQVPPPPALRGRVVHIPTSVSDQTSAIQSAIDAAGSGDTIFFDQGNHVVCGTVNMKAGQLYIGPTVTYPLLGQNTRAVINGCGNTGTFVPASHTMFYGLSLDSMNSYVFAGTTGAGFRNNTWDNHFTGGISIEWTCHGGDTDTTIDWNTFNNGSGHDNGECREDGTNGTNYLFTHNAMHYCENDCVGPQNDNAVNEEYSYNVFDRPGQNCNGCGTASAIEISGTNRNGARYIHNSVSYAGGRPGWAFSIIGGTEGVEVAFNYCGGAGCVIEWDPHHGEPNSLEVPNTQSIHDNFMDACNYRLTGATILGPYALSPGSSLQNNRVLDAGPGGTCVHGAETDGFGTCSYPDGGICMNENYIAGPTANPGIPAPPPAGAAP